MNNSEANCINELVQECHTRSLVAGWWDDLKGIPQGYIVATKIALIHSEVTEALEGDRRNLQDDKLPQRKMVEVELADALIRIFDLSGYLKLDLGGAIKEKLEYNAVRKDHKKEVRAAEGGKKY